MTPEKGFDAAVMTERFLIADGADEDVVSAAAFHVFLAMWTASEVRAALDDPHRSAECAAHACVGAGAFVATQQAGELLKKTLGGASR